MRTHRAASWPGLVILMLVISIASDARAVLTKTCYYTTPLGAGVSDPLVPWFASGTTIDVYYSTYYGGSASSDMRPWTATMTTEAQVATGLIKAVGVWNEQSGSKLRLRYKGGIASTGLSCDQSLGQQCAVLVAGDSITCSPTATADSFISLDSNHKFQRATIVIYKSNDDGKGCHAIPWSNQASSTSSVDYVRTEIHELGHSIFAMAHMQDMAPSSDCYYKDSLGNTILSIMDANPNGSQEGRNLKSWDKEVAQKRYGTRALTSKLMKANKGASWTTPVQVTGTGGTCPLYAPGSETQGLNKRVLGWSDNCGALKSYGAGLVQGAEYLHGLLNQTTISPGGSAVGDVVAVASQGQSYTTPIVMVAQKSSPTGSGASADEYHNDQNMICYSMTSNLGVSYTNACAPAATTSAAGIAAAFNDGASAFLIPFIDTSTTGTSRVTFTIKLLIIPISGTVSIVSLPQVSPMAPAIACVSGSTTCMLGYATDDTLGGFGYFEFTVAPVTFAVSAPVGALELITDVDSPPSLAYDSDDSTFRLLLTNKASAIYSYSLPLSGSTWTYTGSVYNNAGGVTQVSSPAVSTRSLPPLNSKLYAWFALYF